jgi:hypothetical protein
MLMDHAPLPDLLARIAEIIGEDAAMLVAQEWGGRYLYIPREFRPTHRLVELIGADRARAMWSAIGHGTVLIPMGPCAGAAARRKIARSAMEDGKSRAQAAKIAGIHVRTAHRLGAKKKRDGRQGDLF